MLLRRVIPCLDVDKGRVVKGTNFVDIRDAGDPVELAARYQDEGADEIVFLDITASHERRETAAQLARRCADDVFIPFTIGARREPDGSYGVYVEGGRRPVGRDAVEWAREGVERGAGEIMLTSMDRDGTTDGYDLALTRAVAQAVDVPVIASGGAGSLDHLAQALRAGADAALCASIFHYGTYRVADAKAHLA